MKKNEKKKKKNNCSDMTKLDPYGTRQKIKHIFTPKESL